MNDDQMWEAVNKLITRISEEMDTLRNASREFQDDHDLEKLRLEVARCSARLQGATGVAPKGVPGKEPLEFAGIVTPNEGKELGCTVNKIKSATLEVQVYQYDNKVQQAAHITEMVAQGYTVKFCGVQFIGKNNLDEFMRKENWHLVTEFYKAQVSGTVGRSYDIQSRFD